MYQVGASEKLKTRKILTLQKGVVTSKRDNFEGENLGTLDKRWPTSNLRWVPFFLKDNREKARSQSTCQR